MNHEPGTIKRLWRATEGIRWLVVIWAALVGYLLVVIWKT